jgi:hypothetical protein
MCIPPLPSTATAALAFFLAVEGKKPAAVACSGAAAMIMAIAAAMLVAFI